MKALFLGAGASYELGCPLVWELTHELKHWLTPNKITQLNEGWRRQGGGYSDAVIDLMKELLKIDSLHYENLIGALEVQINRERDTKRYQELHGIRAWILELIYLLLYQRQVKNATYISSVIQDLNGFRKVAEESRPLWVFSINHDLNIEIIAAEYGIPIKSGFNKTIQIPFKSPDGRTAGNVGFEYLSRIDITNHNYDFFKQGELGINLVKIHGALDIFAQGDELNYVKLKPVDTNCANYLMELEKANEKLADHLPVKTINEIAYSDSNDVTQFLRRSLLSGVHKFTGKITQIAPPEFLGLFKSYLNIADHLICIGYSFGDTHINEVMRNWLSFIGKHRLEIVDPRINKIPASMMHLCRQITMKKLNCVDYFINLDSRNDSLMKMIKRKVRGYFRNKIRKPFRRL